MEDLVSLHFGSSLTREDLVILHFGSSLTREGLVRDPVLLSSVGGEQVSHGAGASSGEEGAGAGGWASGRSCSRSMSMKGIRSRSSSLK